MVYPRGYVKRPFTKHVGQSILWHLLIRMRIGKEPEILIVSNIASFV